MRIELGSSLDLWSIQKFEMISNMNFLEKQYNKILTDLPFNGTHTFIYYNINIHYYYDFSFYLLSCSLLSFFQVKEWNAGGRQVPMCTARPGWATMSFRRGLYKQRMQNIEINLIDILEVDIERQVNCYYIYVLHTLFSLRLEIVLKTTMFISKLLL